MAGESLTDIRRPLPLEGTIVYGPIMSRRLGISLGINLLPKAYKLCSFDCIYCHYGATDVKTLAREEIRARRADFPSLHETIQALETSLHKVGSQVDALTFSGNGEPTLHPFFGEIVHGVVRLRDRLCPDARVVLFSNASTAAWPEVRQALHAIDLPILKLDAGEAQTFQRVNRPAPGVTLEALVEALQGIPRLIIQSMLVAGLVNNAEGMSWRAWMETVATIRPTQVQIYSTDYPVPDPRVQRVPPFVLRRLAKEATQVTGVPVRAYWPD